VFLKSLRSRRGQSMVEVAISLPALLLLALGVTDLARAFYYREAVSNAARQGLRLAVSLSQQTTANAACTGQGSNPATVTAVIPAASGSGIYTIANDMALESSSDGTVAGSSVGGATVSITWHCNDSSAITNATATTTDPANRGADSVTVTVSYPMGLVTPVLSNALNKSAITLYGSATGRVEY